MRRCANLACAPSLNGKDWIFNPFVNCLAAALLVMALLLARLPLFSPGSLALGRGCAVLTWYLQKGWIRFKLGRAAKQRREDAHFPDEVPIKAVPLPRRRHKK